MKILVATGLYPPESGGPATYAKMIETELPGHDIEVAVVPFAKVRSYPKIIRHIMYFWLSYRAALDVDIVYALDPISVGLPALAAARLRGKKFILRLGGDYAWEQGRLRFGVTDMLDEYVLKLAAAPRPVRILARLQTYVANQAQVVIAPSQYLKRIIVAWGVAPDKVHVIYSSLAPVPVTEHKEYIQQKYMFGSPTIVTAGRLVPWKGIHLLLDIVRNLQKQYPTITLIVIGDGPELETLQERAPTGVQFLGRVTRDVSANIIAAADMFVLNTAYEGLSHQLLEVMDWGTPIVTTAVGGNVELLRDEIDALLVPYNDAEQLQQAIEQICTQPEGAKRLAQSARVRSAQFTQQNMITNLVSVLHTTYETH